MPPVHRRLEIGPDPLVDAREQPLIVPPGDPAEGDALTVEKVPVYGPFGYTFDTDTLAPEFAHTAFVLPAPELTAAPGAASEEVAGEAVRDLSWYFVKLRFRRRLLPSGFAAPPAALESEPTGPMWAQFLPPSSVFAVQGSSNRVHISELSFVRGGGGAGARWYFARPEDPAKAVPLRPTSTSGTAAEGEGDRFQLWALVTEPLANAYGRRTDERFVDFCPVTDGELRPKNLSWKTTTPRVRLMEVQVLPGQGTQLVDAKTIGEVGDFFFPNDVLNLREARARVTRASEPLDAHP